MEKIVLSLLLAGNIYYIVTYLIEFSLQNLHTAWIAFFVISILLSIVLFRRSDHTRYLPILVITLSIASLGAYGFLYLLTHLMA